MMVVSTASELYKSSVKYSRLPFNACTYQSSQTDTCTPLNVFARVYQREKSSFEFIEDERRVGEIQKEGSGCSYSVQKRRDGFMVKTRFDASVAESQQSVPNPYQSVSEHVADSQDPLATVAVVVHALATVAINPSTLEALIRSPSMVLGVIFHRNLDCSLNARFLPTAPSALAQSRCATTTLPSPHPPSPAPAPALAPPSYVPELAPQHRVVDCVRNCKDILMSFVAAMDGAELVLVEGNEVRDWGDPRNRPRCRQRGGCSCGWQWRRL
uniref:Uncharacterized protein n=1 Tax=Ananas comosus var. bracteatus TaxID=296719 RepID=A0A6V7PP00_ANACO|nr:unnamed protein product [Ananas comosus var. bracteatus]